MLFKRTWVLFGGVVGVRAASVSSSSSGSAHFTYLNSSSSTSSTVAGSSSENTVSSSYSTLESVVSSSVSQTSLTSTSSVSTITSSVALSNTSVPTNGTFGLFSGNASTTIGPWDAYLQNYTGPVNGSGTDFARTCNAAKLGYIRQSSLRNPSPTISYFTSVEVDTRKPGVWGTWFPTGALPTECDGAPRFNITTSEDFTLETTSFSTTTYTLSTDIGDWTYPRLAITTPTCTINPSDCAQLFSDYAASWDSQDASFASSQQAIVSLANPPSAVVINGETTELPLITPAPAITVHGEVYTPLIGATGVTYNLSKALNYYDDLLITPGAERTVMYDKMYQLSFRPVPQCSWSDEMSFASSSCSHTAKCTIAAYDVELIYFAPPATSRDICATSDPLFNRKVVTHFSHPHKSVIVNETITLWSDSAYVKYSSISAGRPCQGGPVGATHEGSIVAIPSSDISSMCGWVWTTASGTLPVRITLGVTPYPFNFGDLVGAVPQSAYQCMPECNPMLGTNDCDTIIPSLYSPRLAVPPQVRSIDPAWADCELDWDGSRDPPTAVGSAQVVADPTSIEPTASPPPQTGVTPSQPAQNTNPTTPEPVVTPQSSLANDPTAVEPSNGANPTQGTPVNPTKVTDPEQNPDPASSNNDPAQSGFSGRTNSPVQNSPGPTPAPSGNGGHIIGTSPVTLTTIGNTPIVVQPNPTSGSEPGAVVIGPGNGGGVTLSPGSSTILDGTTLSFSPTGGLVVNDGQSTITIPLPHRDSNPETAPITTIGDHVINTEPAGNIVITAPDGSQYLLPAGSLTVISGTTLLLSPPTPGATPGLVIAHDGTTSTLVLPAPTSTSGKNILTLPDGTRIEVDPESPSVLTIGSQTVTLNGASPLSTVIGSETLVWDPSRGLILSDPTATQVLPIAAPEASNAVDEIGEFIMSMFGGAIQSETLTVTETHVTTTVVSSGSGTDTERGTRTAADTDGVAQTTAGNGARPTGAASRLSGWNGVLGVFGGMLVLSLRGI